MVGLRDGRWKFIYQMDDERGQLYDEFSDANETIDLTAPVAAVTYTSYALLLRTPRHPPPANTPFLAYIPVLSPLPRKRL